MLSPSDIENLGFMWSWSTGCLHWKGGEKAICPMGRYCWANQTTIKFHHPYPNRFEPNYRLDRINDPLKRHQPAWIGVCWMGDAMGEWVNPALPINAYGTRLRYAVTDVAIQTPQHTYLWLTKAPWNYAKWEPFPDNCMVGASVWDLVSWLKAYEHLKNIVAGARYLSMEPLLAKIPMWDHTLKNAHIDWIIIGACTGTYEDMWEFNQQYPELKLMRYGNKWSLQPKIEWVMEIMRAAREAGIPVWIKDNLSPLFPLGSIGYDTDIFWDITTNPKQRRLRQERPILKNAVKALL